MVLVAFADSSIPETTGHAKMAKSDPSRAEVVALAVSSQISKHGLTIRATGKGDAATTDG